MKSEAKHNDIIYITSKPVKHMFAQIRLKQLATKSSQDKLNEAIIKKLEKLKDVSGEELTKQIKDNLSTWLTLVKQVNTSFAPKEALENVGFPIKYNKTALQLEMALQWSEQRELALINDLEHNTLYNGLTNINGIEHLPILQAPNKSSFWGNENPSVSTVLLYSIASTLGISVKPENLMGAATFYPFFKQSYTISDINDNPFVLKNGMLLFGDYQFGGHRYFSNEYPGLGQRIFSPEDCSSAVAKATFLTEKQIVGINTRALKPAYTGTNEYDYKAVTSSSVPSSTASSSSSSTLDYKLIEPGDIYVCGGHTAVVAGKDNFGNIQTLEFNRDIDIAEGKRLGGGTYKYNLLDQPAEHEIYILRGRQCDIKETCTVSDLLTQIDKNYYQFYQHTQQDIVGDCTVLFDLDN